MTALATSPFLTLAFGIASLTDTTMMSPIEAYFLFVPPSTRMHMIFLAPELSATSRVVVVWTMTIFPCAGRLGLLRTLDQFFDAPALVGRQRAALDDLHAIARLEFVLLVVRLVLRAAGQVLAVLAVGDAAFDQHGTRLVHLVAGDDANHST